VKELDNTCKNHLEEINYISHIPLMDIRVEKYKEEENRFMEEKREHYTKIYENIKKNINSGINDVINGVSAFSNTIVNIHNETVSRHLETERLRGEATREIVNNTINNVVNIHNETVSRHLETEILSGEASIELVKSTIDIFTSEPSQNLIKETGQGVNSVYFEGATQIVKGFEPISLAISAANDSLSSINNREKGIIETTGEAIATGVAVFVGGEVGTAIGTGLLIKNAIETNINVLNNVISEHLGLGLENGV